ncbi:hypothetical protein TNCT_41681 [Trichonephila clavata]|uniref:Uncharacterized protein n=1 Tax=Trichonephila clavata TaxID=2740835 RepID=A0A8X6I2H7_TRICU|nr:hypothetical protein TNCT_41681 [Trichonephila clavata]
MSYSKAALGRIGLVPNGIDLNKGVSDNHQPEINLYREDKNACRLTRNTVPNTDKDRNPAVSIYTGIKIYKAKERKYIG